MTFALTVAICAKLLQPAPVQRSILKPVSISLSAQVRLIWLLETAVAFRLVGGIGMGIAGVAALAVLE